MNKNEPEFRSPLSVAGFCEDYLKFGNMNRIVATDALFTGWKEHSKWRALLAGKIVQEYGASIEELFLYSYVIFRVNIAIKDRTPNPSDEFFRIVTNYRPKTVYDFIEDHDFSKEIFELYEPPEPHLIARVLNKNAEQVLNAIQEIGDMLEDLKSEFISRGLKRLYNKFKHPFLVMSPEAYPAKDEYILAVLDKPSNDSDYCSATPVVISEELLARYRENIKGIAACTALLIRMMLIKSDIASKK